MLVNSLACLIYLWVERLENAGRVQVIEYRESTKGISVEMLCGFFEGWPKPPSPQTHLKILKQSAFVILAIDNDSNKVVGFINALSDSVLCAYIPLLEVLPEYRGRGIGRKLAEKMIEKLNRFYMVDLICDKELQPFYEKIGMQPASGMVLRNYERQSGE